MLIVLKNSKITGVDKELLNKLNADLSTVSEIINGIQLQISSITDKQIEINGNTYEVREIEMFSPENIKVFDLSTSEKPAYSHAEEPQTNMTYDDIQLTKEDDTISSENFLKSSKDEDFGISLISDEPSQEETLDIGIIHEETKENKPTAESDDEELLVIPQIDLEETKKENDLNLEINVQEEPAAATEEEHPKPEEDKLIKTEEEKIVFEEYNKDTHKEFLSKESESVIEISFEDDLEEIRQILSMNKSEFNEAITNELKKASDELGIDYKDLIEWHNQLIQQIKDEKSHIYKFLNKKDYKNLHESYHKLKGAALNLRLSKIALVLKKLDELSKAKEDIDKIRQITDDFYSLIENESTVIKEEPQTQKSNENENAKPDKFVESIILQTIQTYLKTQNEAQFQKDKKYIEKILNTKIDTIEDLQNLIKGM